MLETCLKHVETAHSPTDSATSWMVRYGWRRLRSLRSLRPRAAVAAVPGLWATRDPGHEALTWEIWMPGRQLRRQPLQWGGELQVTAHKATSTQLLPDGVSQEWRVLRFIPEKSSSNLIQAINKVSIDADGKLIEQCRNCLLMPYTKSIVSAVLTGLVMVHAPVFEELPEDKVGDDKSKARQHEPRILCIGFGGGSVPSFLAEMLPQCHVDVVELEPAVIQASSDLGFQQDKRIHVTVQDGAVFAQCAVKSGTSGTGYDAVIVDAYDADGNVPATFTTEHSAFFEALASGLLASRGVLVTNFLPGTDLAPVLMRQAEALSRRSDCLSFAIQAEGSGNLLALHLCGTPTRRPAKPELCLRLWLAARVVENSTACPFRVGRLATKGLREIQVCVAHCSRAFKDALNHRLRRHQTAMGKGGAGKGAAPKRWPRVLTSADVAPKQKDPATSLPVDRREEPFLLKHAILEASTWSAAIQPASQRGQTPTAIVQAVFSDEEVAQSMSSLTPKAAAVVDHGQSGEIDVQVLRMSGDSAFLGIVDADMTVAEFKQKLQANTGINVGWQVLLLGDGRELESEQKLAAYSGKKLEKLDIQLQVFKFRDLCRAAVSTDKYGATLSLLQEAQRGDYAVSCVAAYNLGFDLKCSEQERVISFQLLAQTLPLEPACQLVVNAIAASSAGLRHQAAIEFARIFHESPESAECLELACNKALADSFSRSDLAHKLFHHLKTRRFPPRPVPYTGTQISLTQRDPVTVGREHLAKYMDFAKALPAGWHYRTLTPITGSFDIDTHLRREEQEAATMLNMDVSLISKCLTWSMTSGSAGRCVAVFLEPSRLFAEKDEEMSDADIFCGIAEHPRIPAEFTRMALECAARLSGQSHRRALAAACWCAGHKDAAVREQALEVLQCVAQVGDLPAIQSMLQNWWGTDCHSRRISQEIERFCNNSS
eukprot:s597_g26.t1